MLGNTHFVLGMASALVITHPDNVPGVITAMAGGAIGGWIVDVDIKNRAIEMSDAAKEKTYMMRLLTLCLFLRFDMITAYLPPRIHAASAMV